MAGKEHYSYKDFRLQRRISHPFATLVQTIISTSGDEMRASIVQKIMQSDLSEILPSSLKDIHLWVSPLIILLSSIMNHEVSTNRFLAALEEKVLNDPKEVQSNLMAKFVCKLIANALNSMVKDGDEELAANMDTIFKGLFLNNYTIHTLMKEDQKLFPHMLHVFYNNAASGTNDMIEVVLRCIQKVLPVIIFSPQCLSLLEENYAVPEMLYFLNLKKIFDESWKSTLFTLTVVLRSSKMFSLQRNVLIKKVLKNFINDVNHEAFIDFEDQKRFLFVFYSLTHETYALIEAMEPLPEQESEAITGECENTPTSLLDFLMSASESRQSGTQVNDTAVKIVRNIMSSLDSYLCLLHNLEMISILREANLYMDQADPKVTLKVNENLAEIYNSAKKEENENEEMANLNELSRMLMDGGGTVQFFSQNVKFEVAEFETILISLPKEDGPIKFKFSELWGDISGEEKDGVRFIIEYGTLLGIFEATQNPAPDLELLQLSTKEAFKMDFLTFSSFNWFFSTIYLLLEADLERTKRCLTLLTRLPVSKFFIQDLPINHWAMLDYMISKELPHLSLNLQNYGISAWVLCRKWTKECFLLILPWSQLKSLLIFVLVHPERYLFYFWVTFLRENQEVILLNLKKGNLMISNDLSYSLRESIDEISELEEKYNYL